MEATQEVIQPTQETTVQEVQPIVEAKETPAPETKAPEPVIETVKPFEYQAEAAKDPYEKLTPQEVAKRFKENKKELLKEFGYDDFAIGALEYYEKEKDLTPYLEAKSVDYTKLSDQQIVERKLKEQYASSGLSDDDAKLLIEDELTNRYKHLGDVESLSEREIQLSRAKLKADAAPSRASFIERQQQFKAPERQPETRQPEMTREQQIEMARNQILQDENVRKFLETKTIQAKDKDGGMYNYQIEKPEETLANLYDNNRFTYQLAQKTPDGKVIMQQNGLPAVNYQKALKLANYLENMDTYEEGLINYGRTLGKKAEIEEAENITGLEKSTGDVKQPEDVYTALGQALSRRR